MANPAVREARKDERAAVLDLWRDYLQEQFETAHGEMLPTDKTLAQFGAFFDAYQSGELRGVVLVLDVLGPGGRRGEAQFEGVLFWGEASADPGFDTRYDPFAMGWGTYVVPSERRKGYSRALRIEGERILREKGIRNVMGSVTFDNEAGRVSGVNSGWRLYATVGVREL